HSLDQVAVDLDDVPYEPESLVLGPGSEQVGVEAVDTDGGCAATVQEADDLGVDDPHQSALDHLDGRFVGHAQSVDPAGLDAVGFLRCRALWVAPVDYYRADAHHRLEGHVPGEALSQDRVFHRRPSVLVHDRLSAELFGVGQGFHEDARPPHRTGDPGLLHIGLAVADHERSPLNLTYSGVRSVVRRVHVPGPSPTRTDTRKSPPSFSDRRSWSAPASTPPSATTTPS